MSNSDIDVPIQTRGLSNFSDNQTTINNGINTEGNQGRRRVTRLVIHTSAFTEHTQIFHWLFRNLAINYASLLPPMVRRLIEFCLLIKACLCLCLLIYIHIMFVRSPLTCLDHLKVSDLNKPEEYCTIGEANCSSLEFENYHPATMPQFNQKWPRMGILRVEIIPDVPENYKLVDSYHDEYPNLVSETSDENMPPEESRIEYTDTYSSFFDQSSIRVKYFYEFLLKKIGWIADEPKIELEQEESYFDFKKIKQLIIVYKERFITRLKQLIQEAPSKIESLSKPDILRNRYVMEYSLHHGMLRLPPNVREILNISIKLVVLDPYKHKCFGNAFTHFLLDEFLGYNDILIGSFKRLSGNEPAEGYVRNVVDGSYYRFVNMSNSPTSYLGAFFAMVMFTFAVSVLLRYSHHQICLIINDMLRMMETNIGFSIPAAPLFTLILALIAVETIMSEFFGDSLTAFYVIIIVSVADHFEAVCCHSPISKRFWPMLFFLYHFSFYAYNYRFNAQYSNLALLCSWLFIQHSMIYFFHHFDLPFLLMDLRNQNAQRNAPNRTPNDSELPSNPILSNGAVDEVTSEENILDNTVS